MYVIKPITDRNIWDDFVDAEAPSTFLHAYAWGEVEEDMGKKVFRLGVFESGALIQKGVEKLAAVFLVSVVRARRGDFLLCPHGPIFLKEMSAAAISDIFSVIKTELIATGKKENCDFIRICPIISETPEHARMFTALGFREAPIHVYTELSWILDITPPAEKLLSDMKKNTRYGIRKAERDGKSPRDGRICKQG
jgi:lipid II:glycine glycyltransferase (peptidoglycan interpeptide bridge formation enzyme)